ncbi:hypothetical protein [Lactococcus allomyrinae]|uniref:Uncharacterized protein n=1 Tax=Lactococcus allomyrinae TaxID=2419773 RepID=A0A387BCE7_9LACT|nr:hypothetical protein [Lactococcus allomyrinae]AYG01545.1 hypothetical protein D7I46_11005 [Lactococcus allomyrinae]
MKKTLIIIDVAGRALFLGLAGYLMFNNVISKNSYLIGVVMIGFNVFTMFFDKNYLDKRRNRE